MSMRTTLPTLFLLAASVAPAPAQAQPAPIGTEFQINTYTTNYQFGARAAVDAAGRFMVTWTSENQDGGATGIFAQLYDGAGAPLGAEFLVNTYTTGLQRGNRLAVNDAGDFVVAWESVNQDGSAGGVFGQRFDDTGARLGGEFQINTFTTGIQRAPAIAVADDGEFVVAWISLNQDGNGYGIFARRYDQAGAPLGGEFRVNTTTYDNQTFPGVGANSAGAFVVVWSSIGQDGSGTGLFGRRYDNQGVALTGEFQVNTFTTGNQYAPVVAMDPSGAFVVAWDSAGQDGDLSGIFARRFDSSGAPLGPEFQVNTYTTSEQRFASVGIDRSGGFVVAWHSRYQDGGEYGVFGQRFDPSGVPQGAEFPINTETAANQDLPSVGMSPSGQFVVAWNSRFQDGSDYGIFGQRFDCADTDGDGLCDGDDLFVTSPADGDSLDCADPKLSRPTISWGHGNYEKFRVEIGADPGFAKGTAVSSGDRLLSRTNYTLPVKKWRSACARAEAADPNNPVLYVRVSGVDVDLSKQDPNRKTFSQIVSGIVLP